MLILHRPKHCLQLGRDEHALDGMHGRGFVQQQRVVLLQGHRADEEGHGIHAEGERGAAKCGFLALPREGRDAGRHDVVQDDGSEQRAVRGSSEEGQECGRDAHKGGICRREDGDTAILFGLLLDGLRDVGEIKKMCEARESARLELLNEIRSRSGDGDGAA